MISKILKKLTIGTVITQIILSAVFVMGIHNYASAAPGISDEIPGSPNQGSIPTPGSSTPTPSTPGSGGNGGTGSSTPAPTSSATSHVNVKDLLSANGQQQRYFQSGNPIASAIIQIINFLVLTVGSVCFIAIVIGGFILMTSHGNENMVSKGKDIITMAIIGLIIVLMAYFITSFVQNIFYELPKK